jgi:DNA-binding IclR family transcriptional regulator
VSTLQTLDRGLSALEIVSQSPQGITVANLAKELGVHRAICYRLVITLESHLLLSRHGGDGLVRLGAGVAVLASRFDAALGRDVQPLLHKLANATRGTAFLSAAEGDEGVAIMVAEPENAVPTVGYRVGARHPLSKGAAGIAILAARPEGPEDPEPVQRARRDGYSVTRGQLEEGAVGVASGVRVSDPRFGWPVERSIGVVALNGLDVEVVASAVLSAARELAQLIQGHRNPVTGRAETGSGR